MPKSPTKKRVVEVWLDVDSEGRPIGCPESDYVIKDTKRYSYWGNKRMPLIPATLTYALPKKPK